jgi:hypothetical protein
MKQRCGWCKRKLSKERKKADVPIGTECQHKINDTLHVAILNCSSHGGRHDNWGRWASDTSTAEKAAKEYFGDEVDLIIMCKMEFTENPMSWITNAYLMIEGRALMIHHLNGWDADTLDDTKESPFYNTEELIWKRRVSLMINENSRTEIKFVHIDPYWIDFINSGEYMGPIHPDTGPDEWAQQNAITPPMGLCQCDGYEYLNEDYEIALGYIESYTKWQQEANDRLLEQIYNMMIEETARTVAILDPNGKSEGNIWNDFKLHDFFIEGALFKPLERWVKNPSTAERNAGVEWDSDQGNKILVESILPILLRGIGEGYDDNWKWLHGTVHNDFSVSDELETIINTNNNWMED